MKNKNNIIIILIVVLSVLTVIALVLITGFSSSGGDRKESSVPLTDISQGGDDVPDNVPGDGSDASEVSDESAAGESSDDSSGEVSEPSDDDIGRRIAALASSLIGTPFAENGETPSGFDNSGFIYYVLRENGYITCPRTTEAQSSMGASVGRSELKPGDLVFFGDDGSGEVDFGGIYIGNGMMVACLMPDTNVKEVDITSDYYASNFIVGVSLS